MCVCVSQPDLHALLLISSVSHPAGVGRWEGHFNSMTVPVVEIKLLIGRVQL